MASSHIPSLSLLRFDYNKNTHDLNIIAHVEVDLNAAELVEIQDPVKISIVSFYQEIFVKEDPSQVAAHWTQDLAIPIVNEILFDPNQVTDVSVQIAIVRERLKEIADVMGVLGFEVSVNATEYNSTVVHIATGGITCGDSISIN